MSSMVMRTLKMLGWVVVLVGSLALAVLALPLAQYPDDEPGGLPASAVPVVERRIDGARPAKLELRWSSDVVLETARDGLVTEVIAVPESQLDCASAVGRIDGRVVISFCASAPLWRPVTSSTVGTDADSVWAFLGSLGLLADPMSRTQRSEAIRAFRYVFGLGDGATVEPGDLVWSKGPVSVDEVLFEVGDRVVAGQPLLVDRGEVVAASVMGLPADRPASEFVVAVGPDATVFAVGDDASLLDPVGVGTALGPLGRVDGVAVVEADTTARLETPLEGWAIPASAVVQFNEAVCVAAQAPDGSIRVVVVEIVGYSVGSALVTGDLRSDDVALTGESQPASC